MRNCQTIMKFDDLHFSGKQDVVQGKGNRHQHHGVHPKENVATEGLNNAEHAGILTHVLADDQA